MNYYPENYIVSVQVGFTDKNGAAVVPTTVSAKLYDGEDVLVQDIGVIAFNPGDTSVTINIQAAQNQLGAGQPRAARVLRASLVTANGTITHSHSYVIESEQRLVLMTNSFMSYETADLLAVDLPNALGWSSASEERRKVALVEAFKRLTNIPMRCVPRDPVSGELLVRQEWFIARDEWGDVTADAFQAFPSHFRRALRRAQIIEANEILQGENIANKQRQGIISEKIGESSVTLATGRVSYGVSSETIAALVGYLHYSMRLDRA